MSATELLDLYAVTAPGLEPLCRQELAEFGVAGAIEDGGVAWRGDRASLYRANLECRTASRVLVRLGAFRARTFAELERHAARLEWQRYLTAGATVALRVTARKSRLYHTGAIAERIGSILSAGGVHATAAAAADEDDDAATAQLVVVRFLRDECLISIDSSGALLHQRGYRLAVAKAPLRETVAAALIRAAGWPGDVPLVDPLCGSGTIPIEAALAARRIAPGIASAGLIPRRYAFEMWPGYDAGTWRSLVDDARARVLPAGPVLIAADAHGGGVAAAQANAERAGVAADITFVRRSLDAWSADTLPREGGWIVTNPPWGVRVGERRELYPLYARLGRLGRSLAGWHVAFLSADPGLEAAAGAPLRHVLATRNGGLAVRLVRVERDDTSRRVAGTTLRNETGGDE